MLVNKANISQSEQQSSSFINISCFGNLFLPVNLSFSYLPAWCLIFHHVIAQEEPSFCTTHTIHTVHLQGILAQEIPVSRGGGGATTTGPDTNPPPPAICQNLGGGGWGASWGGRLEGVGGGFGGRGGRVPKVRGPTRDPLLPHAYLQGGCVSGVWGSCWWLL